MGFPAAAVERLHAAVHKLHRLEESGVRCVQNCRPARSGQTVGHPEESPVYELRQDVAGPQILLQGEHSAQGPGRATLLPVSIVIQSKF